jgi:ribosomal protein S1
MEQRAFMRVPFDVEAVLTAGGTRARGRVTDLSIHGAFVETDEPIESGTRLRAEILLHSDGAEIAIRVQARVARLDAEGIGLEFEETGIESFAHLKRILSLNAGDPKRVLTEFQEFVARGEGR